MAMAMLSGTLLTLATVALHSLAEKRCFATVFCSKGDVSTNDWIQILPQLICHAVQNDKQCFAPVTCSDDGGSSNQWLQISPQLSCPVIVKNKKCFTPVVCSEPDWSTYEWLQIYPRLDCLRNETTAASLSTTTASPTTTNSTTAAASTTNATATTVAMMTTAFTETTALPTKKKFSTTTAAASTTDAISTIAMATTAATTTTASSKATAATKTTDSATGDTTAASQGLQNRKKEKRWMDLKDLGWFERSNGYLYQYFATRKTWVQAKADCSKYGGILASVGIRDAGIRADLRMRLNGLAFWIGITDTDSEGIWMWEDGVKSDGTDLVWQTNQPDNVGGNEDCGLLFYDAGIYKVNDENCESSSGLAYLCEISP